MGDVGREQQRILQILSETKAVPCPEGSGSHGKGLNQRVTQSDVLFRELFLSLFFFFLFVFLEPHRRHTEVPRLGV